MGLTQKLGTIPLAILTDASNNVGIGGSPSGTYKFEVTGTAKVSSTLLVSGALTGSSSATFSGNLSVTGNNLFTLAATNVTARIGEYDVANRMCLTANQNGSNAQDDATKPSWGLLFNANSTDTAFIGHKAAGGGSAALISLLTIAGTGGINIPVNLSNSNTGLDLTNSAGSGYGNAINFYQSTTKYGQILCETSVANTSEIYFKTMVASTVATRLFISSAGNIGIGTLNPTRQLFVNSTAFFDNNGDGSTTNPSIAIGSTSVGISYLAGGNLAFLTGALERMRIDSAGKVGIGVSPSYMLHVQGNLTQSQSLFYNTLNAGTEANILLRLGSNCNNTNCTYLSGGIFGVADKFYIYGNGNMVNANNSYGPLSDIKLKENITDATPKLDKLMQVRIVNYNLISDPNLKQIGVIAQELEQIFPGLVDQHIDKDEEGNLLETTTKSVKMSVFVPMLIKAMQEQQEIIQDLKSRLDKAGL